MPKGKGKKRENTKERQALLDAHEAALDELAHHALEGVDGVMLEDVEDDFDALMAGMGESEEEEAGLSAGLATPEEEEEDEIDDEEEGLGIGGEGEDDDVNVEPSSFSRIPTAFVHQHLQLPTTAVPPAADVSPDDFPALKNTSAPYVVELNAGEMLYLPASWWHEVTSSSAGDGEDAVHMAFNYWFYPPNQFEKYEEPYEDGLVWEYYKAQTREAGSGQQTNGKRKARDNVASTNKKVRQ